MAHFRYHRAWAGYDLIRDVARTMFDFARGRPPARLSGAFYQALDTVAPYGGLAPAMLLYPFVRGLLGLEPDAPHRAVAIEPHLPAHWNSLTAEAIPVGDEHLSLEIRRDDELYTIAIRRTMDVDASAAPRAPLAVRLAPALPLGARIVRVTVNGRDVALQVDESRHDVHSVVELSLEDEAVVEIEFHDGIEVVPPPEKLRLGQRSEGLRILDFRRDRRGYVLLLEGVAGRSYPLELRTRAPLRDVRGAAIVEEDAGRVTLRVDFPPADRQGHPPGDGEYVRKEVRLDAGAAIRAGNPGE